VRLRQQRDPGSHRTPRRPLPVLIRRPDLEDEFCLLESLMKNVKRSILSGGLAATAVVAAFVWYPSTSTLSPVLLADSLNCNLSQYKAAPGLTAAVEKDMLVVSWNGQ